MNQESATVQRGNGRTPAVKNNKRGQSGAALILVLIIVTVLVALALETLRAMQIEEASTRYFRDSQQAEALAKSGVHLAMALLAKDLSENDVDHAGEQWALVPQEDVLPLPLPEGGKLGGKVEDESGKFPINYLVDDNGAMRQGYQQVLERLLTHVPFAMEAEEARALVMAIKDWVDEDDEPSGEFGAEKDYYQNLENPYLCKNGPLSSLAQLMLIRGMSAQLYSGEGDGPGLKDLLTVHSGGKININTAGSLVLQALVSSTVSQETAAEWAENVIAYRQEPMHWDFLKETDWYRNRMAGFNDITLPTELITTQSMHFSVHMTGTVRAGRKAAFAYLERTKPTQKGDRARVTVQFWQVY